MDGAQPEVEDEADAEPSPQRPPTMESDDNESTGSEDLTGNVWSGVSWSWLNVQSPRLQPYITYIILYI